MAGKRLRKWKLALLAAAFTVLIGNGLPARAAGQSQVPNEEHNGESDDGLLQPFEIYCYEDLLQMAEDPAGSYRLMDDIDMEGLRWMPVDFCGLFDGNGHSLLNLEVRDTGAGVEETYDGNYKVYDACFAGLFGTLKDAEVSDLNLVNVKVRVETDQPCFIGSIAGYFDNSVVRDCNIRGSLELAAHDRMLGVGGVIGYGNGLIERTMADVTLVCTDTDASTRDEQFMGGACAAGYPDLNECTVRIDGYDSDHGYVHDGGLVGMYIFYPRGLQYQGRVTGNSVSGQITFFEDNTNRRAYCSEYIGEIMNWDFANNGNSHDFTRNEVFDYSVDLKPDPCIDAVHTEVVTEPGCDTFGFTTIICGNCGYSYTDHYTLYQHSVTDWTVTREPTMEEAGVKTGICSLCGKVFEEEVDRLDPVEAEDAAAISSMADAAAESVQDPGGQPQGIDAGETAGEIPFSQKMAGIGVLAALVLALAVGELLVFRGGKRQKR